MCRNLRLRGDDLKLTYFQLLSSDPIYIPKVGGILSPKLKDISAISDNMYQYYLNILLMDLKMFFAMINRPDDYEKLTDEKKLNISVYDLLIQNAQTALLLQTAVSHHQYGTLFRALPRWSSAEYVPEG